VQQGVGTKTEYAASEGLSTTTFATEQVKLSHVTTATAGNYFLIYSAEISNDANSGQVRSLLYNGASPLAEIFHRVGNPALANEFIVFSGAVRITLSGAATIQIRYLRPSGGGNAEIRRARLALIEVA